MRNTQSAFWELTAAELAALTDDEMRGICKLALMEAGVLEPKPPTLLPEEAPTLETEPVYVIAHGGYQDLGIAFRAETQAAAAMASHPMRLEKDWQTQVFVATQLEELRIERREVPTAASLDRHKDALRAAAANKRANEAANSAYRKACEESSKITKKLWDARTEAVDRCAHLQRIRATFAEYVALTGGDDAMARSFIAKVATYDADDVREAIGDPVPSK